MVKKASATIADPRDTKAKDTSTSSQNSYDVIKYESRVFHESSPQHLRMMARLFGMNAPKASKARVLELGCGVGGNIMPLAVLFPEAKFVGVDLSEVQITEGKKDIDALGLKNIELTHMSISDIDIDFGEFDYIICHGVFSWVPKQVQWDIIRVCKENLSKHGVAYVSYNTLPGWGVVSTIRDMMVYHTKDFSDPKEKVSQAITMLKFALENQTGETNHWKVALEKELKILTNTTADYVFHEHLEENNNPMYFYQFIEMANKAGLKYLGDSSLASMYVGNMTAKAADTLKGLTNQVHQEQYMDFVRNRRFRSTLLCHDSNNLNFNLSAEKAFEFYLSLNSSVKPDFDPTLEDWTKEGPRSFNNGDMVANDRIIALAMIVLMEKNGHRISANELVTETTKRLGWNNELAVHAMLGNCVMELAMRGGIFLYDGPEHCVRTISEKPEVWRYAWHRAEAGNILVNVDLKSARVDFFYAEFAKLLDGNRTKNEAIDELKKNLKKLKVAVKANDGSKITDEATIDGEIEAFALKALDYFLAESFLVA
ncbi:MAG: class I SAM-dependent methyltransferase [Puniceicoccales bacterium]|jgi:methyltransferase-like protein/2-polyprenyl-3-methyl-5-hydroxy-6-metoxy-1,4-benzoquinol methylase|nr:class I SAM-dependent methyltransferase [Puniceicoccales bacterium]